MVTDIESEAARAGVENVCTVVAVVPFCASKLKKVMHAHHTQVMQGITKNLEIQGNAKQGTALQDNQQYA